MTPAEELDRLQQSIVIHTHNLAGMRERAAWLTGYLAGRGEAGNGKVEAAEGLKVVEEPR